LKEPLVSARFVGARSNWMQSTQTPRMSSEGIDLRTLSYELFELTGQKLFDMYDFLVSNPLVVRLISNSKRVRCVPGRIFSLSDPGNIPFV
jgi:hypothetical protein